MLEGLEPFFALARSSRAQFLAACPDHALIVSPFGAPDRILVETMVPDANKAEGMPKVAWVRKRAGANAFAGMITIGRTANNDIHVDAAGVSKFHAYLRVSPQGEVILVDANSTHGTFVRDRKLAAREEVKLDTGTPLRFGNVHATFFTPSGFFDMLVEAGRHAQARGKKA